MLLQNNVSLFLEISRLGGALKKSLPDNDLRALNILMDIENILDKCRMYTRPDNEYEQIQLQELVANMDDLRSHIRKIMDTQDADELRDFMINRGRTAQNQFSLSV
jgi:hypothetical protein